MRNWREHLSQLLHRGRRDRELAEEMRLHLEMKQEELQAAGLTAAEAEATAKRSFGNALQFAEESRWRWLPRRADEFLQDLRYAWRSFGKSPVFLGTALITLALGIGANTAIFSLVEAVLLRRLPVAEPQGLVEIQPHLRDPRRWTSSGADEWGMPYPVFEEIAANQRSFSCLYARNHDPKDLVESDGRAWEGRTRTYFVSGCYFRTLGLQPQLGRFFDERDMSARDSAPVAVLSDAAWRSRFSADPNVVGRTVSVERVPLQIIGVMPPAFQGDSLAHPAALWIPIQQLPRISRWDLLNDRGADWFDIMGRLRSGVTAAQATSELTVLLRNAVRRDLPEWTRQGSQVKVEDFRVELRDASGGLTETKRRYERSLKLLMGVVAALLLMGCLNLAGLLLARTTARAREIGVRLALGASRGRMVRQMMVEALMLAGAGAVLGIALADLFATQLVRILQTSTGGGLTLPYRLNGAVLSFTAAAAFVTALLAGLLPALQGGRLNVAAHLTAAGRALTQSGSQIRWKRLLVAGQIAAGVVLASSAALMLRSLQTLYSEPTGYQVERISAAFVRVTPTAGQQEERSDFERQGGAGARVLERLRALPGVQSAALADMAPMSGWMMARTFHSRERSMGNRMAIINAVSAGYFETLNIPLLMGRTFDGSDESGERRVAVIDEETARALFPGGNPLGQLIGSKQPLDPKTALEVIGVVRSTKWYGPKQDEHRNFQGMVWQPLRQARAPFRVLLVRSSGPASALAVNLRAALKQAAPSMFIPNVATLTQLRDDSIQQERLLAILCLLFGLLALVLVFAGLYGLLAYSVERRAGEIGIRVVMGAPRASILRLLARESLLLALAGLAAGLPLALALSRLAASFLWKVEPADPLTYVMSSLVILGVALAATAWPARRALRIEPLEALRQE